MGRVKSVFRQAPRGTARRRRQYGVLLLLFALVLLVVNVAGWRVYTSMHGTLEAELGDRLSAIAVTVASSIDPDYLPDLAADPEGLSAFIVRDRFERLDRDLSLANLVLLDREGRTLLDLGGGTPPGETHPLHVLHPDAFAAARSGIPSASTLIRSLDTHYKNGYAPLVGPGGDVEGVVAIEAGVEFFEPLREIRRVILFASLASAGAIVFLAVVFLRLLRTEQRLEAAMHRTESLSLMGEMAASVAHEIKNPLGIIRASAELLRKRHGTGEEIFDYIPEEVDRLDAILRTYLDFARGETSDDRAECRAGDAIDQTLRLVERDLETSGIGVRREVQDDLVVGLSAGALQQVLLNLVLNARQAMEGGGTLGIRARASGAGVVIDVEDSGVGIAKEDLERVFQPFHSGRPTGSGLGLAIAQRVVADAGGRVAVTSRVGEGTTFTISLPRLDA